MIYHQFQQVFNIYLTFKTQIYLMIMNFNLFQGYIHKYWNKNCRGKGQAVEEK